MPWRSPTRSCRKWKAATWPRYYTSGRRHLPIIVLSGYPHRDSADPHSVLPDGIVAWLTKPLELDRLARAVADSLAGR